VRWEDRARALADSVSNGRLVIADSGHFIQLDRPEAVADAVRSVLETAPAPLPS
jgi:pimeloyl-ACP methyl ester carboxylesterase